MSQLSLLIVMIAALVVPLTMARFKISFIPNAVAEIVVGIILGETGFNLIHPNADLTLLSSLGVIILLFLSGMEIDFDLFKPQPANRNAQSKGPSPVTLAGLGFTTTVASALLLAVVLHYANLFNDIVLATILFSTIALGIVIAALKEKELLSQPLGQTILLTAALGEVLPLLAMTIYASFNGGHAGRIWLIVIIFVVAIILLRRFRSVYRFFADIDKSTTQLDIRLAFFLIFVLVTVAEQVGAENILGAFLAGMVMKLLNPSELTRDKLTSIGYGFFIPIFFIMSGAKLNLRTMITNPATLVLIPVFFACFIAAKGAEILIFKRRFKTINAVAAAALTSTTITLVLPTLQIARNLHAITTAQSGAFTLAAVLTAICSPIVFNRLFQPQEEEQIKTTVTFVGTNLLTIPVAQKLPSSQYDIRMLTDSEKNYRTYNSEAANVQLIPKMDEAALDSVGAFDCDLLVLGYRDGEVNYALALDAVKHGTTRIIARFERDLESERIDELQEKGVEIFNSYNVNVSLLRGLIETPSTLKLLTDTEAGIYEAAVNNRKYTGITLMSLPDIQGITISRIYRQGRFVAPHGDTLIEPGDHLLFTGDRATARQLQRELTRRN
ncbi:cation:proton antiporter [Lacticaseibacillus pabuli]|uniref:Cation:proton antiporter n=1 Tax=Lacticaseibacillus pabuli TaxID=3025672 RepID=A0ABY7WSQ2_9LACO|nr:cation:proton antiporter [Lacticaseibacillus sp. KACC 23028]WDF82819.1 cation:proton antiporter [Lacticaseibacillus sp. KACC 23028]